MSSSSSSELSAPTPVETVEQLLSAAIGLLARELPTGFTRFVDRGQGLAAHIEIDDETFTVDFSIPGSVDVLPDPVRVDVAVVGPAAVNGVQLRSSRSAVDDVLRGRVSMVELLADDRLRVVGPLASISQLDDTLIAFMQAAVRCPSMPDLLRRFSETAVIDVT